MKNKNLILKKIPITVLMQMLGDLCNERVNFVDIEGESSKDGKESDVLRLKVEPEYYSEEPEIFINLEDKDDNVKLTDEDINDLI